ncbi:hypothetical protein SAMN05216524_106416 [Mucilaginibacter sp. OK098]|nr:hypothetical protein SAMN05216524_106416 [Mucilaginibacter sp. OK098]
MGQLCFNTKLNYEVFNYKNYDGKHANKLQPQKFFNFFIYNVGRARQKRTQTVRMRTIFER